jgi:hypothetical protein
LKNKDIQNFPRLKDISGKGLFFSLWANYGQDEFADWSRLGPPGVLWIREQLKIFPIADANAHFLLMPTGLQFPP